MRKKQIVRLTEGDLHRVIKESVRRVLREEAVEDFYNEEDSNGNFGEPGMVKSYEIGYATVDNMELHAEEMGYENLEDFLKFWWEEIGYDCPFTWQRLGQGYGFNGTTLVQIGNVKIKKIWDQIMVDEYPPHM